MIEYIDFLQNTGKCNIINKTHFKFHVKGWLVVFKRRLEQRSGLLPSVWDSSLRMVRRHAITILIRCGEDVSSALVPAEV